MGGEDECTVSIEYMVAPDTPMLEDYMETPNINTHVLDVTDRVEIGISNEMVEDSLNDIVLDSDEEGSELVGSTRMSVLKETKPSNAGIASDVEKRKPQYLGNVYRRKRKFSGHSLLPLSSSRNLVAGTQTKTLQHAASFDEVDTTDLGSSNFSDNNDLRNADTDFRGSDATEKRSAAKDAPCHDRSSSSLHLTKFGASIVPSIASLDQTVEDSSGNSPESQEASEKVALNFVDRFLSLNDLDISEDIGSGKTGRINSPPSLAAKGAQTLARKANVSPQHLEIFDWSEKQTCESNFAEKLDELFAGSSKYPSVKSDTGKYAPAIVDIGFDTQIAAEAMEALKHASPPRSEHVHQVPQIGTCNGSELAVETNESEVGTNSDILGLDSLTSWRQTESLNDSKKKMDGHASCSSGQLPRNDRASPGFQSSGKNKFICGGPLSENTLCSGHPFGTMGNLSGRNSGGKRKLGKCGTRDRLMWTEACPDISSTKSVRCKGDDPIKSSKVTKGRENQISLRSFKRSNDLIVFSRRKKNCKMGSGIPEEKSRQNGIDVIVQTAYGIREEASKLGSVASIEMSNVKKTQQDKVIPGSFLNTCLLKLDLPNYPKGKRTRTCVPPLSNGSGKSSALSTLAGEAENSYRIKNIKPIKRRRVTLANNEVMFQSIMKGSPSIPIRKPKPDDKCLPGICVSGSATLTKQMLPIELNRGHSSEQSTKFKCRDSISSIGNSCNVKFAAVGYDAEGPETCKQAKKGKKFVKPVLSNTSLVKELTRLGYDKSLPNYVPRESRRRKGANVRILFSQHLDCEIVNQQKKIMVRLGFQVASCCSEATHFVSDRFVRTRNMLEAIARGKPVVTHFWLESCCQANSCIDERSYILRDAEKEKEIGFEMPRSLSLATQHPLLQDQRILVTPNIRPDEGLIKSLVKAVHGKAVSKNQRAEKMGKHTLNDVLILSSAEDHSFCVPFLEKGAVIYDSELLLTGIITQKLEYERYRLFTD